MKSSLPTICALSTPQGSGAIALVRVSGDEAFEITDNFFEGKNQNEYIRDYKGYTIHFGSFKVDGKIIDEVLVSVFKAPNSYTGENLVEISCHGSSFIIQQIMLALMDAGARLAEPGEFTMRAYLNEKMDLSQAEGVADLIAAESAEAHQIAMNQLKGGFSKALGELRNELLMLMSLIELELDFAEEDVKFADRSELGHTTQKVYAEIRKIQSSFQYGNAMKDGIAVVIAGNPNVGKSTLLNLILKEEKAIVSEFAGTTRDSIEDTCHLDGTLFRFIDTAGLRETSDHIEKIGIERTLAKIKTARILLYMLDAGDTEAQLQETIHQAEESWPDKQIIFVLNKADLLEDENAFRTELIRKSGQVQLYTISARENRKVDELLGQLIRISREAIQTESSVIISSLRHYEALKAAGDAALRAIEGLEQEVPTDLLAEDLRQIVHYIGEITGEITTDEILGNIFRNFCIGK